MPLPGFSAALLSFLLFLTLCLGGTATRVAWETTTTTALESSEATAVKNGGTGVVGTSRGLKLIRGVGGNDVDVASTLRPHNPLPSHRRLHHRRNLSDETEQGTIIKYHILTSQEIFNRFKDLANIYTKFATLQSSQDIYDLPAAGKSSDCPFDADMDGCKNWYLTIEDKVVNPTDSMSYKILPEVFLSGALHGNERVGPTSVVETAELLLMAADCEAKPDISKRPPPAEGNDGPVVVSEGWKMELEEAKNCRSELADLGITTKHRKWLARLVSTRRIVILPTANALGYYRNRREEGSIDPNRDFPYDLTDSKLCMRTIAGRTINEIFRDHIFQLSLTFHAGQEVVGYEWGAPTYAHQSSPDDAAQAEIAGGYSKYGGGWKNDVPYAYGNMNDKVYPVRGGMEDWAYAASWDPDRVVQCTPTEFDGYPKSQTKYDKSTLRMFNMLIEAANIKTPPANQLGTSDHVFNAETSGNGHISRNIRLSLMAIDVVEPYLSIMSVNGINVADDIVPLLEQKATSCIDTRAVQIPSTPKRLIRNVQISWTVGGAFTIDDTFLVYGRWFGMSQSMDCQTPPGDDFLNWDGVQTTQVDNDDVNFSGTGQFHADGPSPHNDNDDDSDTLGPTFTATLNLNSYPIGDPIVVMAVAKVDTNWGEPNEDASPKVGPQSHIVNVRTNPDWHHVSSSKIGQVVQGRKYWFSKPMTILVGDDHVLETVDLGDRFKDPPKHHDDDDEGKEKEKEEEKETTSHEGDKNEPIVDVKGSKEKEEKTKMIVEEPKNESQNKNEETTEYVPSVQGGRPPKNDQDAISKDENAADAAGVPRSYILALGLIICANLILFFVCCRMRRRFQHRVVATSDDDLELREETGGGEETGTGFSQKPYRDVVDDGEEENGNGTNGGKSEVELPTRFTID